MDHSSRLDSSTHTHATLFPMQDTNALSRGTRLRRWSGDTIELFPSFSKRKVDQFMLRTYTHTYARFTTSIRSAHTFTHTHTSLRSRDRLLLFFVFRVPFFPASIAFLAVLSLTASSAFLFPLKKIYERLL